ncbi:hypothetical protein C8R46DRAFT_1279023 [Mycena filopes]|nr:hypothetical protein C8R46DRAFT_1279023 [Mycena filopes]
MRIGLSSSGFLAPALRFQPRRISSRTLRPNPRRDLRFEFLRAAQNPDNLLDSSVHSSAASSDSEELLIPVPYILSHHYNLDSPPDPLQFPLYDLFDDPPPSISSTTMAAVAPQMPARGDRNAPQFDSTKPRELHRYFTDLEFHFTRANVTDSTEKKRHATRFLSVDDQDVWESLAQFGDPAKSHDEFKAAVLKLYPGNDANRKYSLGDLDALIGEYVKICKCAGSAVTSVSRYVGSKTLY